MKTKLLRVGAIFFGVVGLIATAVAVWMALTGNGQPGEEAGELQKALVFEGVERPAGISESAWLALATEFALKRSTHRDLTVHFQVTDPDGKPIHRARLKLGVQKWEDDFASLVKTGKAWSESLRILETDLEGRATIVAEGCSAVRLLQVKKEGYRELDSGERTFGAEPVAEIGTESGLRESMDHRIVLQDLRRMPDRIEKHRRIVAALRPVEDVARLDAIAGWRWRKVEVTEVARTRGMKSSNKSNDRWDLEYSVRDDSSGPGCTLSIHANQGEIRLIDPISARQISGGSSESFRPSLKIAFTEGEVSPGGQLLGFLEFRTREGKVWGSSRLELRPHEDGRWIVDFREVEAGWTDGT